MKKGLVFSALLIGLMIFLNSCIVVGPRYRPYGYGYGRHYHRPVPPPKYHKGPGHHGGPRYHQGYRNNGSSAAGPRGGYRR